MAEARTQSPDQKQPNGADGRSRLLRTLIGLLLLSLLFFVVAGYWLVTSESGARFALAVAGRAANTQFQGVSGSLHQHLRIQHIGWADKNTDLSMDDVEIQWQPGALFRQQVLLEYVRINRIELALAAGDGQPLQLPQTLRLPDLIRLIRIVQLDVHQFQLADLGVNRQHMHPIQFSALRVSATADSARYTVSASGTTPWGNAKIHGNLAAIRPFNLQAQIGWTGLAMTEHDVTLPVTQVTGSLSGNLSRIQLQARINTSGPALPHTSAPNEQRVTPAFISTPTMPTVPAKGSVRAILTPFSALPVDTVQAEFSGVNPRSFYSNAPKAALQMHADFTVRGESKSPELSGHIDVHNDQPMPWNTGGVPLVEISTDLTVSEHKIRWQKTRIALEQKGLVTGDGEFVFARPPVSSTSSSGKETVLPQLTAQLDLKNVNLLRIDNRLKTTRLNGKMQVQNKNQELEFGMALQESDPQLRAQLRAEMRLNNQLELQLRRVEVMAKEAILTGSGSIGLRGRQAFSITGAAQNFNPARWIDVPEGRIATRFQMTGQIQQGWQIDAQIAALSGQFAGMDLHGESDFHARQNGLLMIKKLDLNWGKNHLSAQGDWQPGNRADLNLRDQLQFSLAVPDLTALSRPFEKIMPLSLQGSLFVDGVLSGTIAEPGGHLTIQSDRLAIPDKIYLDKLQADLVLEQGKEGKVDGNLMATNIGTVPVTSSDDHFRIERLQATLSGLRHAHNLEIGVTLPQNQQLHIRAAGDLRDTNSGTDHVMQWVASVSALDLSGPVDFQLQSPFHLLLGSQMAQMEEATWRGKLGQLHMQTLNWQHGQLQSSGQFQDLPVIPALRMWRKDLPLSGQLTLNAAWSFDLGDQVSGQMQVQRSSGDLAIQDMTSGQAQSVALGLQNLLWKASIGNGDAQNTSAPARPQPQPQPIQMSLQVLGNQLGSVVIDVTSAVRQTEHGWAVTPDTPLAGQASLQIKDISWMSQLSGSGVSVRGALNAQATLHGTIDAPAWQAQINGQDLQIALTELGVLLPNGKLDARIDGSQFTLNSLKFSQRIKAPPKHDYLLDLSWLNQTGYVESTGSVDLQTLRGSINTIWEKFPFLQTPESWMVASGQAQLTESEHSWNLTGKSITDAAYFSVPKQAAPKLSGDVVVLKKNAKRRGEKSNGLQSSLDFSVSTGKKFIFVGRGIDTRLDGEVRIRSKNGGAILATGSIQTVGGNYEGYGQQLAIDRGIVNFQGPVDNPGLNVRAIRRGLPVEAGVEVLGTVARPEVHLISEPNVPDPDKLSWLVLGRASDQMAGSETALLMSAASAIFGGDESGNIPGNIAHALGLGDLSFGTTSTSPDSQLPAQTVAGTISNTVPGDQVFSVGKRIAPDIIFSIERSLTEANNGLKLTWQLTRRFSVIGRAGSDTAIDGQYTFSFD